MTLTVSAAQAENKKEAAKDSLRFTVIKENPITPVKDQSRSGTCWDYATIGFFEGEILRKTGRTYDHVMLIFGKAKDQQGREYYMVKNSWGEAGRYKGIWYMSKNYIALNTTYVFLNRCALE